MTEISAAELVRIEFDPSFWQLNVTDEFGTRTTMLTAYPGQPLQFSEAFAKSRRMPKSGTLPPQFVRQIIAGWSADDQAWHIGLLLKRDIADARGSRWCELANWPDPDQNVFAEHARIAGDALSQVLGIPFSLIDPTPDPAKQRRQDSSPSLPDLPLQFGMWSLDRAQDQANALQFTRSGRWTIARLSRILWYLFLGVLYVLLSVATLNSDLALPNAGTMLPNPELLPYLGLIIAVILMFLIIQIFIEMRSKPNRILIDPTSRTVAALLGKNELWRKGVENLRSVYVTQEVNKGRKTKRTVYHGEINLHLGGDSFEQILEQADEEDSYLPTEADTAPQEEITPLTPYDIQTDLQAAAVYIAKSLGDLPVWYDQRLH